MRKDKLILALIHVGLSVTEANGIIWVRSVSNGIMYLRSRCFYTKTWIYLHCYLHRELFDNEDWRGAYQFITNTQQKPNNMEQTLFTNVQVRAYLNAYYAPTFTKGKEDHWYNHRNRKTIGLPSISVQSEFTEREVVDLFSDKGEHPAWVEIARFKNYITNQTT